MGNVGSIPRRLEARMFPLLVVVAWTGNALYAAGDPNGLVKLLSSALVASAMILFLFVHGGRFYGRRPITRFIVIVFGIGWSFETLSVMTSFPFGAYHYTELMEPFIGHVPISVMPAYCVMGYVSWSMAMILTRRFGGPPDRVSVFAVPPVAAGLMVVWDLSMDPLRSTLEGRWSWIEGGAYYGVPVSNFFGWALVTWVMFQLFALILARGSQGDIRERARASKRCGGSWAWVPLMYASFAVESLLNPFVARDADATLIMDGSAIAAGELYLDVAIITASTMVPISAAALLIVVLCSGARPRVIIRWRRFAVDG